MTIHRGSTNDFLSRIDVGQRVYFETSLSEYTSTMRRLNPINARLPAAMRHMEFRTALFTAVSARNVAEVRYLVCVERIK